MTILRYSKQLLAIAPANFLAFCGGFHLAYGIFNSNIGLNMWMFNYSIPAISMISISYHISIFIGGAFGSLSYRHLGMYKLHILSALAMLIGSITFFISEKNYFGILSSRILVGFGYGSSYISSLFYIAEISSPNIRSRCIIFQHFCMTLGMLLHTLTHPFNILFEIKVFLISLTTLSLPIGFYTMKESHVFLIHNDDKDSLERLRYFRGRDESNLELEHDAMQNHLIAEGQRKFKFFNNHKVLTLLIIIIVQNGFISISNGLHNYLRLLYMKNYLMEMTETVAICGRIFGIIASFIFIDLIPKKFQYSINGMIISGILAAFGGIIIFHNQLWLPLPFFITTEFLFGFGICGISEILKSQVFPMKERYTSMIVVCVLEEGLQVASLVILYSWTLGLGSNPTYWAFVFSGILLVCSLTILFTLKNSRQENLVDSSMMYSN